MLISASTIRSKLAASAAMVALVAGMLAAPAAAETEHKRWLPNHNTASRPGNVEQGGREVNLRYGGHDRGTPPAWLHRPGEHGRKHGNEARYYPQSPSGRGGHGRHDEGRRYPPPPSHADSDDHRGKHKHDKHYHRRDHAHRHDHGGRHEYYRYSYYYAVPYTRVVYYPVPYPTPGHAEGYGYYEESGPAGVCDSGYSHGGRYVMGGSHEPGGAILGGIVGAAIGSQVGGGKGRLAAVGVGALIGAVVGRDIGRSMDSADQAYATGSFGHAMEYAPTCSTITWNNPRSGSSGTVTPVETYEPQPGRYCREFQQEVVIGGKVQDAYGTACRQPDGSWEIVTE